MNYKEMNFDNSIDDWNRWLKEFPNPMDEGEFQKTYVWDTGRNQYYISLVTVEFPGGHFIGKTIRKWEDNDFVHIDSEEEEKVLDHFSNHIERYEKKYLRT